MNVFQALANVIGGLVTLSIVFKTQAREFATRVWMWLGLIIGSAGFCFGLVALVLIAFGDMSEMR